MLSYRSHTSHATAVYLWRPGFFFVLKIECLDYPLFSCKIGYTSFPLTFRLMMRNKNYYGWMQSKPTWTMLNQWRGLGFHVVGVHFNFTKCSMDLLSLFFWICTGTATRAGSSLSLSLSFGKHIFRIEISSTSVQQLMLKITNFTYILQPRVKYQTFTPCPTVCSWVNTHIQLNTTKFLWIGNLPQKSLHRFVS